MPDSTRQFRSTFPQQASVGFRSAIWKLGVPGADEPIRPLHSTLIEALEGANKVDSHVGIRILPEEESGSEEHLSYVAIQAEVLRMAGALAKKGIRAGDRVIIVLPTSFDFIVSFFALMRIGAVPVPSYPPAMMEKAAVALERLGHIANHAEVSTCITTTTLVPLMGELVHHAQGLQQILAVEKLRRGAAPRGGPSSVLSHAPKPSDTAFIQYTSGSTGNPKGVHLTHQSVCTNIHVMAQGLQLTRDDVGISWLPLYHDMGLVGGFLMMLFFHLPITLMSPMAFLARPVRWLQAITRFRVTMAVSPNFGYALCVKRVRPSEREGLDLSSLRLALNGAEPVNLRTVADFERAFAPYGYNPRAMFPVFGQAESVLAITFPTPGEPLQCLKVNRQELANGNVVLSEEAGAMTVVGVGRQLAGHRVITVDTSGAPVPELTVGHIVVRGPSVMKEYYRGKEATQQVLRHGWLWTGDLGFFANGTLFVTGRVKDLIIIRGHNYYAEDIERVAERVEGVRPGGTAAFALYDEEKSTDVVAIVVESKVEDADAQTKLVAELQDEVATNCGVRLDEVVLVPPGTIPKTSSGKRQRALTRQRYMAGELLSGSKRAGGLKLAMVFARSGAGLLRLLRRQIASRRREPE